MSKGTEAHKKWNMVRQLRGSACLPNTIAENIAWLLSDGRTPEEIKAHLTIADDDYTAATTTELFKRRLDYLTKQANRKVKLKMPTTPDECLAFAKRSLVKLSKSAETDKTKVDALKALAAVAIDERKNAPIQGPQVQTADADLLKLLNKE